MATPAKKKFSAVLENSGDGMDTAYVSIPYDVEKVFGSRGQIKVKATFDGHLYRGVLANMGTGCHIIGVQKAIRKAIGKQVGDEVDVTIEPDTEERVVEVPADLKRMFTASPGAKKFFETLSFTNRKEYVVWITSAKKDETRQRRLEDTIQKLLKGLKNPSAK